MYAIRSYYERDPLRSHRAADLRTRVEIFQGAPARGIEVDAGVLARARRSAEDWRRRLRLEPAHGAHETGAVVALAYPDRVGRRRGPGAYTLAGGRGAVLDEADPLAAEDRITSYNVCYTKLLRASPAPATRSPTPNAPSRPCARSARNNFV